MVVINQHDKYCRTRLYTWNVDITRQKYLGFGVPPLGVGRTMHVDGPALVSQRVKFYNSRLRVFVW